MRVLAFDHFFGQDLDAIEAEFLPGDVLIRVPFRRWHNLARRYFPADAFDGLARAFDDDLSACWVEYRNAVKLEVDWVARAYSPSLFLVPSDSFFYIRPFIEAFRSIGIATFVLQKETTISPMVMEDHSLQIGRYVPFMSDFMTVCSERHRDFWVRAGTDSSMIEVTGQPRFDIYALADPPKTVRKKRLLFLSYDDIAYLPADVGRRFEGTWKELRLETESCVTSVADKWDVVVKEHPQQANSESKLGVTVSHADRYADTRELIKSVDAVLGFQTTALYEAVIAGKPVIYAAWGETFDRARHLLIGFEDVPGLVTWAKSSNHLRELLAKEPEDLPLADENGMSEALRHLGPVTGSSARITLNHMRQYSRTCQPRPLQIRQMLRRIPSALLAPMMATVAVIFRKINPYLSERLERVKEEKSMIGREITLQISGTSYE